MMIAGSALLIQRDARHPRDKLPARFARLARIATIVVAPPSAASATKTFTSASAAKSFTAAAPWAIGLWLGLIDGQGTATKVGSVQRGNRLVGFSGIVHFHERETSRASCVAVRHQADLVYRAVWLKDTSQFSFGRAVGQVTDIKVLHCRSFRSKSSFNKSSKLRVSRVRASAVAYSAIASQDRRAAPADCAWLWCAHSRPCALPKCPSKPPEFPTAEARLRNRRSARLLYRPPPSQCRNHRPLAWPSRDLANWKDTRDRQPETQIADSAWPRECHRKICRAWRVCFRH